MSQHEILETERLLLRPLEIADLEPIEAFMGIRGVTDFLLFFSYPLIPGQVKSWLEGVVAMDPQLGCYWAIVGKEDGRAIGVISLTLETYHRKGEIGFWLARDRWNRGYMTEAAWRVICHGFDTLKLHRIEITHMVENRASRRVIEKLGFQPEGCWREGHFKEGCFRDVAIYGMLEVDYLRTKKRFAAAEKCCQ
ncbi:MAG: GNAT family N-acetyltransferase [Puniceicoccales bacterium]|nr:GNAT family N-acetyltransferase [Puniceicoccales bacterium]